jgi:DNA repair exonuclease SbcCD ATPase subunit
MKTQQQASIESLQFEIDNLIAQKQQLEALPKVISDPLKYAQSVAQKVAESAPKVRQIDALIDGLQNLIKQRQAETDEERQRLKAEQDKAELNGILKDFKALGDKLDAIAKIEAKTLSELRELYASKSNRLWQLTQRSVVVENVTNPIDYSPIGDGKNPGLQRFTVKVTNDSLVIVQKRTDTLQSILEG